MSAALPKLLYFDTAGRAFPLRVAMFKAFGKDGWVDERVDFKVWSAIKPTTPLGSLPILELSGGKVLTQADALARWAGKQGGLYPTDATEALCVDEAMAISFEALNKTPGSASMTEEEKKAAREEYAAGFLTTALKLLESRVTTTPGPFVTGNHLTIGDLSIAMLTDMIVTDDFTFVPASLITENFPGLVAHRDCVQKHALVENYLANYKS